MKYIEWVVANARMFEEVELDVKGETNEELAASLVAEIRLGLHFDPDEAIDNLQIGRVRDSAIERATLLLHRTSSSRSRGTRHFQSRRLISSAD